MKCQSCGKGELRSETVERYQYDECGLDNVVLICIPAKRCTACNALFVGIPAMDQLHRVLASSVIAQKYALMPAQVRFLREYLGLLSKDFAKRMGVTPETVTRWESGKIKMGATAERLLRLLVAKTEPRDTYGVELFDELSSKPSPNAESAIFTFKDKWQPHARSC
jgi:putative zinc finger/helix-turn-helix YgiT family protein